MAKFNDRMTLPRWNRRCSAIAYSAVIALAGTGCGSDKVTAPAVHPAQLTSTVLDYMRVGLTVRLVARVIGSDSLPMQGVLVRWNVPVNGGTLDSANVTTDARGYATTTWKLPMAVGEVPVTAHVDGLPTLLTRLVVTPEFPGSINIIEDTLRFSWTGNTRSIRVVRRDYYGNPVPPNGAYPRLVVTSTAGVRVDLVNTVTPPGAAAPEWLGDTAVMLVTSTALGRGVAVITSQTPDGGLRDSVVTLTLPVPAGIRAIPGGLDPNFGLAVGQSKTLLMTVVDSGGNVLPSNYVNGMDLSATGLKLSSSNPSVVSVTNNGVVAGVAPGTATITAVAGAVSYTATIPVYPLFDLGVRLGALDLPHPDSYTGPISVGVAGSSTLVNESYFIGRGEGSSSGNTLVARTATGALLWSRTFPAARTVTDPAGGVFVLTGSYLLSSLDASGATSWTYDYSRFDDGAACATVTRSDAVVMGCGQAVFAVSKSGTLAWSDSLPEYVIHVVTTPQLTIVRTANFVFGIDVSGAIRWSAAAPSFSFPFEVTKGNEANAGAQSVIADATSRSYLVNGTIRALNADGTTRWDLSSKQADCILALGGATLVCRQGGTVTAINAENGSIQWTRSIPTGVGGVVALSDGGLAIVGEYLFRLDSQTGSITGRSLDQLSATSAAITSKTFVVYHFVGAYMYSAPFGAGSDWAQTGGNAARSEQAVVP